MSSSGLIEPDPHEKVDGSIVPLPIAALQTLRRTPPAVLTATPNPVGLLMALRRRWWLAMGLAVLGGVLAAGSVWFLQKPTFTARTFVHVHSTPQNILFNLPDNRIDFPNFQRSQLALVKSRPVLNSALQNPKVSILTLIREKTEPVAWLETEIRADFSIAPEILRISMNGDEPKDLFSIVEAVRDAYLKDIVYKEHDYRRRRLSRLRELFADVDKSLSERKKNIKTLVDGMGTKDPLALAEYQKLALEGISESRSELIRLEHDLFRLEHESTPPLGKDGVPTDIQISNEVIDAFLVKEPELVGLIRRVSEIRTSIDHIKLYAVDPKKTPGYEEKNKFLQSSEEEIEKLREKLRPIVKAELQKKYKSERQGNAIDAKQSIKFLKNLLELRKKDFDSQTAELKRFNVEKVNVEYMQEEIALAQTKYKTLSSQIDQLEVELQAPERVSSLDDTAVVPDTDTRIKKSAMAGAGIFALILFGIALLEFRQRRVNNVDEVVRGLDLRLMGTLPAIPNRTRRQVGSAAHPKDAYWQNVLTESVDSARTMLLHMARLESRKVVMVTSAVGGEGKTMLSCHLAISLARAGLRTLLVDCDLRSAAVHKVFGLAAGPGFGNLLSGDAEVAATIQVGPLENLWVLAAGQSNTAAFQALAQHRSREIFKQLKDQFDFVLVDSAPMLPVADSLLIAPCVDAVILSILRDVSRLPMVYAAYEKLAALRVHFLGAVVNGAPGDYYRSRYPYASAAPGTPVSVDE